MCCCAVVVIVCVSVACVNAVCSCFFGCALIYVVFVCALRVCSGVYVCVVFVVYRAMQSVVLVC